MNVQGFINGQLSRGGGGVNQDSQTLGGGLESVAQTLRMIGIYSHYGSVCVHPCVYH